MGQEVATQKRSILLTMASHYGMEAEAFESTVRATCSPSGRSGLLTLTREEFAAFLVVANQYGLNPLTKEIYAFPKQGGGIVPVVSVDGWINLINSQPQCDGWDMQAVMDAKGEMTAYTCSMFRKDRSHPVVITEYLSECQRPTDPWKMKHRMLRHKALIQAGRYAFGFAGIYDEDEGERIADARDVTPKRAAPPPPPVAGLEKVDADGVVTEAKTIEHEPLVETISDEKPAEKDPPIRRAPPPPPRPTPAAAQAAAKTTAEAPSSPAKANGATGVKPVDPALDKLVLPVDPDGLKEDLAAALAEAKDEDEAEAAYTRLIGKYEDSLFPPDVDKFVRMLRHRISELEP